MDEITDQNQPVSHPRLLTCASCIRAGQRAAAGNAARARAELVTYCAALATALGSNRNAIYKALVEARRILLARLAANGRDLAHLPGAP